MRPNENSECIPCPKNTEACDPTFIKMRPGYMLDVPDDMSKFPRVLHSHHCPRPELCPGGNLSVTGPSAMCALGSEGRGCAHPAPGYGKSDTTAFSFCRCASSRMEWTLQLVYVLGRDILIYAVSMLGAYRARKGKKKSSVLLNLAMSFGTVATICFAAVRETKTVESLREGTSLCLWVKTPGLLDDAWVISRNYRTLVC